jgi:LPS export ABC transporter protein LptC
VLLAYMVYEQVGGKKFEVPLKLGDATFNVNKVQFWQTDPSGRLQAAAKLDEASVYQRPNKLNLNNIQLQWTGDNNLTAEFSANKAVANATTDAGRADKLTLSANVFAKVTDDNNAGNNLELQTAVINLDVANKLLSAPLPVVLKQGASTLRANKFDADLTTGDYMLYGVNAVYLPQ